MKQLKICENMDSPSAPPFVIWTLQRTGGTNLATRLVEISGLVDAPHEPFNLGRIYGSITQNWNDTKDRKELDNAVDKVIAKREIIKHCVETVPWEITESLARSAMREGYGHLFLYRKTALNRLLSLHFAEVSNVWGPDMNTTGSDEPRASKLHSLDNVTSEPLPVEKLIEHERFCIAQLEKLWKLLITENTQPAALAYEDIYQAGNFDQIGRTLTPILSSLGLAIPEETFAQWISNVVGKGEQGTRELYKQFPGVAELAKRCEKLPFFSPRSKLLHTRLVAEGHPWIERAFIDVYPKQIEVGEPFELGGVCVLTKLAPDNATLQLVMGNETIPLEWDIASQRMAKEHPIAKNGGHARWRGTGRLTSTHNFAIVELVAPDMTSIAVMEALVVPKASHLPDLPSPKQTIFDVGANDGADTDYYLSKGFRVVAVEAIPDLANSLRQRHALAITDKRLVIEQAAVHASIGETELTINPNWTEWSSAHGASKAQDRTSIKIRVPSVTLAELISRHGTPYYVKIDIEGGELDAIQSLQGLPERLLPAYLSFEGNSYVFDVLQLLWELGYRSFQLIRQGASFLPSPAHPSQEGESFRLPWTNHMSGPFGCDLPQERWDGLVEIIRQVFDFQHAMRERSGRGEEPGWFDIHARKNH